MFMQVFISHLSPGLVTLSWPDMSDKMFHMGYISHVHLYKKAPWKENLLGDLAKPGKPKPLLLDLESLLSNGDIVTTGMFF